MTPTDDSARPNVTQLAHDLLRAASTGSAGRASELLVGGPRTTMTQTLIGLQAGQHLSEHENPGEATVLVLEGRIRLYAGDFAAEGATGELLTVPPARHGLEALEDSAVLLTAVRRGHERAMS